jgi:hypothetical protein
MRQKHVLYVRRSKRAEPVEFDGGASLRQLAMIESGTSMSHGLWAFGALALAVLIVYPGRALRRTLTGRRAEGD